MERRTFLRIGTGSTAALFIPFPSLVKEYNDTMPGNLIRNGFSDPPHSARPFTYWVWMNGNITEEGITRDLEFLKAAGVGGVQLFEVTSGIPKGPVNFGSGEWLHLLRYTAKEAARLGLELNLMNGCGYSASGGPWITPELGMQQLTWSETHITGGKNINTVLAQPYTKLDFYRDTFVIAFPTPGGELHSLEDTLVGVITNNGTTDKKLLTQGKWPKGITLNPTGSQHSTFLQIECTQLFKARSIMLYGSLIKNCKNGIRLESSDNGILFQRICDLSFPDWRAHSIEVPAIATFPQVKSRFFRLVFNGPARINYIRLLSASCIMDWPHKANFTHAPVEETGKYFSRTLDIPKNSIVDPDTVLDITQYMDKQGQLRWQAPKGNWTILRMGHTAVGISNHPAPEGGSGLECDKYSKEAYEFHFSHFFEKILPVLKALGKEGLSGAVIDSYEVGMQTWTTKLPEEFTARRGYDFRKFLPALVGYVIGSGDVSDRFLWDIRRTEADMMADYYYGCFAELCRRYEMRSYAEAYGSYSGGGPFDEFQSGSRVDVPMGEFWAGMGQTKRSAYSSKLASSIGHIYNKQMIAAESFTGIPKQTKWQLHPYAFKSQGDWLFTRGINKFVFHSYAHQPHPSVKPGMTMGPWGWMHSRNNTWADQENEWVKYIQRAQYILQQGFLVADIVYFAGEGVPIDTPALPSQLYPSPPVGYYYDVSDENGILTRMSVEKRQIKLPDGMHYRILVLPESNVMSLSLIQKIRDMVRAGICIVGPKPERTSGLSNYQTEEAELRQIAGEVWGDLNGDDKTERSYGEGMVFWTNEMASVLNKLNIPPDFEFTSLSGDASIHYIHRNIEGAEVYFIANRRRLSEELVCSFRVKGMKPEFWNAETGEVTPIIIYEIVGDRTRVPVRLEPSGSVFVVFRSPSTKRLYTIKKDNEVIVQTKPYPVFTKGKFSKVSDNFTISVWIEPETDIGLISGEWITSPTSFILYPPDGYELYGEGHAICGLTAGRNGVIVYERYQGELKRTLTVETAISGWTCLTLVYNNGTPLIYLNSQLAGRGKKSNEIVHPSIGEPYDKDCPSYFHGEMEGLKLFPEVLTKARISKFVSDGIPMSKNLPIIEQISDKVNPGLLFWQNGKYTLHDNTGQTFSFEVSDIQQPININGPWNISFPPNLGAPDQIQLDRLISFKDHPNDGIKYFSGTATYHKTINMPTEVFSGNKRLYLDLGKVAFIAEIRLNGKKVSKLWKPPYRADVTDFLKIGENKLEINVTNLWPNRLIGDEQLPPENEYDTGLGIRAEFKTAIKKLPDWYVRGKPKPAGGRITFATWKHFDKGDPLLEAGLLGPIRLRLAMRKNIRI